MNAPDPVRIGIVSVSDRASSGTYEDKGLPALKEWLGRALKNPIDFESRLIPDETALISATLIELVNAGCSLVLTTGGTGPAPASSTAATASGSRSSAPGPEGSTVGGTSTAGAAPAGSASRPASLHGRVRRARRSARRSSTCRIAFRRPGRFTRAGQSRRTA